MTGTRVLLAFLGFTAFLAASCGRADEGSAVFGLEKQTFALVNDYRKSEDLPALIWDRNIAKEARDHSRDMALGAVEFGHAGFQDRIDRLRQNLLGVMGAGENVLMTSDPQDAAKSALALWLKSPPHRKNIRGDFVLSGLGVWKSPGGDLYFTQIFVKLEKPVSAEP